MTSQDEKPPWNWNALISSAIQAAFVAAFLGVCVALGLGARLNMAFAHPYTWLCFFMWCLAFVAIGCAVHLLVRAPYKWWWRDRKKRGIWKRLGGRFRFKDRKLGKEAPEFIYELGLKESFSLDRPVISGQPLCGSKGCEDELLCFDVVNKEGQHEGPGLQCPVCGMVYSRRPEGSVKSDAERALQHKVIGMLEG